MPHEANPCVLLQVVVRTRGTRLCSCYHAPTTEDSRRLISDGEKMLEKKSQGEEMTIMKLTAILYLFEKLFKWFTVNAAQAAADE